MGTSARTSPLRGRMLSRWRHRLHDLVLEQPCDAVGDSQMAAQLQRRRVRLRLGDQADRHKPGVQRQVIALHHRAHAQAALILESPAQPVGLVAAPKRMGVTPTAARAHETLRPAAAAPRPLLTVLRFRRQP